MYFMITDKPELCKVKSRRIRHQNHISCSKNALKLTYSKMESPNSSGGGSPDQGEEGDGRIGLELALS
jgi:hypothetical protein